MNEPQVRRRLHNIPEFRQQVSICSHLEVSRPFLSYNYHFLVTYVKYPILKIIQYGCYGLSAMVHEITINLDKITCFNLLDFQSGLYLIKDPSYPSLNAEKNKAIQRSKGRLVEKMYQASSNNCEHFVTHALTGIPKSVQMENSGIAKRIVANIVDSVVEWKSLLSKTIVRIGATKMTEVINNYEHYKDLARKSINKYPDTIKSKLKFVGHTSESIANMITEVVSSNTVANVLGYGSIIVEIGALLRDIVMYTSHYIDKKMRIKDLEKLVLKRMASTSAALCLDLRFISGLIASITSLPEIAGFAFLVLGVQFCVSSIASML